MQSPVTMTIPVASIQSCDHEFMESEPHKARINGMVETLRAGGTLPPIQVMESTDPESLGWRAVEDGNHRLRAYKIAGVAEIVAVIYYTPWLPDLGLQDPLSRALREMYYDPNNNS